MTSKLDIIVDKSNRIEANTAHTRAQTDAIRSSIDEALTLLNKVLDQLKAHDAK